MYWQDYPSLKFLLLAARKLKVKSQLVGKFGFFKFEKNTKVAFFYRTKTPFNNQVAVCLAESKYLTGKLLQEQNIPSQKYFIFSKTSSALKKAKKIGFPLVVKPTVGAQGEGVTANIRSQKELLGAIKLAKTFHPTFVLSPHFPGNDYRLLVLKNKVIAAIKRESPQIIGDGQKTIQELINQENQRRKKFNQRRIVPLKTIKIDQEVKRKLQNQNLKLSSILNKNQVVILRNNANWSSGGIAGTISIKEFHPSIIKAAVKASRALTLGFAGVDLIIQDIKKPLKNNGIILEINSAPAIGVFHQPIFGQPQKVALTILKAIFE